VLKGRRAEVYEDFAGEERFPNVVARAGEPTTARSLVTIWPCAWQALCGRSKSDPLGPSFLRPVYREAAACGRRLGSHLALPRLRREERSLTRSPTTPTAALQRYALLVRVFW